MLTLSSHATPPQPEPPRKPRSPSTTQPARGAHPEWRLPGYTGTIVRDGYKGYAHLTDALHAWCGAHGLRDLAGLYRFDPEGQVWARSMADLLIDANAQATAARAAGQASLDDAGLAGIRSWYRGAVAKGIADNPARPARSPRTACPWPAGSATTRT